MIALLLTLTQCSAHTGTGTWWQAIEAHSQRSQPICQGNAYTPKEWRCANINFR